VAPSSAEVFVQAEEGVIHACLVAKVLPRGANVTPTRRQLHYQNEPRWLYYFGQLQHFFKNFYRLAFWPAR